MTTKANVAIVCNLALLMIIGGVTSAEAKAPLKPLSIKWTLSTPLPDSRSDYAAGVIDGKLILAGGTWWEGTLGHWTKKRFTSVTHAFDPRTQKWERLPNVPVPLAYSGYTTIGNKLFVIGGYTGTKVNRKIYTLAKKDGHYVWSVFGTVPVDRLFAQAMHVGTTIYLLGGSTRFEPMDAIGTCCTTKTVTNTLFAFDTAHPKKGWRQLASFPGPPRWLESAVTDGKSIWMFGGTYEATTKEPVKKYHDVMRYDLASGKWSTEPALLASTAQVVPATPLFLKGRILLFGQNKKVWQLDLSTLHYTELTSLPVPAIVDKFLWLDGEIIGAGGESTIERPRRRSNWTIIGHLSGN